MMEEERHYQFVYICAAAPPPLCDLFHFNSGRDIFKDYTCEKLDERERILANKGKEKYKEQEMRATTRKREKKRALCSHRHSSEAQADEN
jgi:hypothetical protein